MARGLAGYIRVSTGGQLDGFGLEDQEQIVRRWTRANDHKLVKVFVEKAVSGTVAGDERPELGAALSWIEDKKVDGTVALNLDRLAHQEVRMERGSYGTPMVTFRVPTRKPDLRRTGRCPTCQAMQGERCFRRPPRGIHPARVKANGIDSQALSPCPALGEGFSPPQEVAARLDFSPS
ncbi:recombinase family protein [Streptomyces sp. NPDC001939]